MAEFQDKDEGRIQQAYDKDEEIQAIKNNLAKKVKEMKGVALGLCQWKDGYLWYQGKSRYQMTKNSERVLYKKTTTIPYQDIGEQQNIPSWSADDTTGQD